MDSEKYGFNMGGCINHPMQYKNWSDIVLTVCYYFQQLRDRRNKRKVTFENMLERDFPVQKQKVDKKQRKLEREKIAHLKFLQ